LKTFVKFTAPNWKQLTLLTRKISISMTLKS